MLTKARGSSWLRIIIHNKSLLSASKAMQAIDLKRDYRILTAEFGIEVIFDFRRNSINLRLIFFRLPLNYVSYEQ